jgi:hypothetical protein
MSQRALESVLGRLITDVEFRQRFFKAPADVCRADAIALTPREQHALLRLDPVALQQMTDGLDPRIVRAASLAPAGFFQPPCTPSRRRIAAVTRRS